MADRFEYVEWHAWVTHPLNSTAMFIGFLMLILHAWVGVKDVIMDYVHPLGYRALVFMIFGLGLLACLIWAIRVLLLAILL